MKKRINFDTDKGNRFKKFRIDHLKITQTEFANELNISQSVISTCEKGKIPSPKILDYCSKRGLNIHWYYTEEGKMKKDEFQADNFLDQYILNNSDDITDEQTKLFKFFNEVKNTMQFFIESLEQSDNDQNYINTLETLIQNQLKGISDEYLKA